MNNLKISRRDEKRLLKRKSERQREREREWVRKIKRVREGQKDS